MAKKNPYKKSSGISDKFFNTLKKEESIYVGDKKYFMTDKGYYIGQSESLGKYGYVVVPKGKLKPYTQAQKNKIWSEYFNNPENEGYWLRKQYEDESRKDKCEN